MVNKKVKKIIFISHKHKENSPQEYTREMVCMLKDALGDLGFEVFFDHDNTKTNYTSVLRYNMDKSIAAICIVCDQYLNINAGSDCLAELNYFGKRFIDNPNLFKLYVIQREDLGVTRESITKAMAANTQPTSILFRTTSYGKEYLIRDIVNEVMPFSALFTETSIDKIEASLSHALTSLPSSDNQAIFHQLKSIFTLNNNVDILSVISKVRELSSESLEKTQDLIPQAIPGDSDHSCILVAYLLCIYSLINWIRTDIIEEVRNKVIEQNCDIYLNISRDNVAWPILQFALNNLSLCPKYHINKYIMKTSDDQCEQQKEILMHLLNSVDFLVTKEDCPESIDDLIEDTEAELRLRKARMKKTICVISKDINDDEFHTSQQILDKLGKSLTRIYIGRDNFCEDAVVSPGYLRSDEAYYNGLHKRLDKIFSELDKEIDPVEFLHVFKKFYFN